MMFPSSLLTILIDAAARSLLVAAVVGIGLTALRTRNVVAQKSAWTLVLIGAMLMPWAAGWVARASWLPETAAFVVSARKWSSTQASQTAPRVSADSSARLIRQDEEATPAPSTSATPILADGVELRHFPAPAIAVGATEAQVTAAAAPRSRPWSVASIALLFYLAGCCIFLARLVYGLWAAAELWFDAVPVYLDGRLDSDALHLRASERISSPVTVGSGIVLPADFGSWDAEKLRIVLAHEASHVRQGDFYLQLCASLYTAFFWFSPLGWWLKRKLGDLSESISDRAAVSHAASHASYAQVLLEFAALPRPISMGVAMAHHGRLIPRIERLLNESSFRQAFAGGRTRIAAAVLLVPVAIFAATALVRVEAAQQTPPQQDTAPKPSQAQPPDESTGIATPPEPSAVPASPQAPQSPAAPPAEGSTALPPGSQVTPPALAAPRDNDLVRLFPGLNPPLVLSVPGKGGPFALAIPNADALTRQARALALLAVQQGRVMALRSGAYRYGFDDGNTYAYVTGNGEKSTHFSGNWYNGSKEEIEKARKVAHGDFLWFERDGKSYVIDDPAALAPLKTMQDKMDALGEQQEALGKQQEDLGRQQEALGNQQEQASVPTPDVSKELAQLNEAIKKLDAQKGGTVTAEQLAEIESRLGDLQGRLGDIQGKIGAKQGELGEKQGKLGEQQGELGEKQGRLGEEQGRIAREMDGKVLTIIDEYLKNVKARPVQ